MPARNVSLRYSRPPDPQSTINMFTNFTSQYYKRFFFLISLGKFKILRSFFYSLLCFVFASIVLSFETINGVGGWERIDHKVLCAIGDS